MSSPPYVKDLRTPERVRARAARKHGQAPTQAASNGIPASAATQGTGLSSLRLVKESPIHCADSASQTLILTWLAHN